MTCVSIRDLIFSALLVLVSGRVVSSFENYKFTTVHSEMEQPPLVEDETYFSALLRMAGPALFLALQVSCIMVAIDIFNMGSVRKFSSVPFASLMANGILWTEYGWLKSDNTIFVPNVVSIATAAFCMVVYYQYALVKPVKIYLTVLGIGAVGAYLGLRGDADTIGIIGCLMSVAMSGSPLVVIQTVLKEKSTASLPFWTSFVTWLNSLSWVLYGYLVAHDNLILLPNCLGLLLGSLQMALFVRFGIATGSAKMEDVAGAGRRAESARRAALEENPYNV